MRGVGSDAGRPVGFSENVGQLKYNGAWGKATQQAQVLPQWKLCWLGSGGGEACASKIGCLRKSHHNVYWLSLDTSFTHLFVISVRSSYIQGSANPQTLGSVKMR